MSTAHNDYSDISDATDNKHYFGTKRKHLCFYEDNKYAFISIDRSIIDKLGLSELDSFTEEITGQDILLRRARKER